MQYQQELIVPICFPKLGGAYISIRCTKNTKIYSKNHPPKFVTKRYHWQGDIRKLTRVHNYILSCRQWHQKLVLEVFYTGFCVHKLTTIDHFSTPLAEIRLLMVSSRKEIT